MEPFTSLTSTVVSLPVDDIDTDQIIPARYLKTTDKNGLGDNLFSDWRYDPDGSPRPDFVLNQPGAKGAQILFAGRNFGCGSSREHAPWALAGFGFRAVIAASFADIFRNNALKNGLLPVQLDQETHRHLSDLLDELPGATLTIRLAEQELLLPDGQTVHFPIEGFSKTCLLKGMDELGYLLSFSDKIAAFESRHSPTERGLK
jgi:3-isopropylmalate/(R)-2-methylmalate dehydratase small subunit